MAAPAPGPSRFLSPEIVAGLGTLELKARTIVEGLLLGLHRSPFRGSSVEFAEYRQYIPGDDPATVDWKVYARSDRHYVKKFEHDTNVEVQLLVDTSASMAYASGGASVRMSSGVTNARPMVRARALAPSTRACEARSPAPHFTYLRTKSGTSGWVGRVAAASRTA